jgi:hypothetical protein
MPLFINPFRKRDASTFPGVLIPLSRVRPDAETDHEATGDGGLEDDDAPLLPDSEAALEGVKAELEKELAEAEGDTAYDRMCDLISTFGH